MTVDIVDGADPDIYIIAGLNKRRCLSPVAGYTGRVRSILSILVRQDYWRRHYRSPSARKTSSIEQPPMSNRVSSSNRSITVWETKSV